MKRFNLFLLATMLVVPAIAESESAADDIQHNIAWGEAAFPATGDALPPISFVYGGRSSSELLPAWTRSVEAEEADGAIRRRTVVYRDPASGFEVRIGCRMYLDTPGVDWTIYFANRGNAESLPLEQVRALDTAESVVPLGRTLAEGARTYHLEPRSIALLRLQELP